MDGRPVIGTGRYLSGSLFGWVAVQITGHDVEEVVIPDGGNTPAQRRPAA